ncbi:MAG TPA: hypothetical protein VMV34_06610 [Terriglobia bacterium]|nr:hypothetical protein [Terriglobia bacterium]
MKASSTNRDPFAPFDDAGIPKEFSGAAVPKEFSGSPGNDQRFRDFVAQEQPVERYGEAPQRHSTQDIVRQAQMDARRMQFAPIGQVVILILGKRTIDFSKHGPQIGYDGDGRLKIPTPVSALPTRNVMKDKRGNTVEDLSRISVRRRAALMATCKTVKVPQKMEEYAAGTWNGSLVLAPLTGIVIHTLGDQGYLAASVQFFPDSEGKWPMMLYNPKTGMFEIVGGGGHVVR